jgi:tetratricopeptide (TPR) repeat protein
VCLGQHTGRVAVLVPLGELGRILDCLREAEALAEALGDQLRLGQVSIYMAQYFWLMGDPERTIELGERALTIASTLGDFALQVNTNLFLGQGYRVLGDYRRAIDALQAERGIPRRRAALYAL